MQNAYTEIWLQLNRIDLKPIAEHSALTEGKLTFSDALQFFREHTRVKIINLRALTKVDEVYLTSKGISAPYLSRNLEKTIKRNYRDSWAFQLNAVRKKALYAVCPFTGKFVESVHSLLANINTVFYRFQSKQVFYIATAGIPFGFEKHAVYFPEYELIVTTGDSYSFEEADLVELKARVVSNFELCYEYLSDQNRESRKTAVCLGFYHFAHQLLNELSGIQRLHKSGLLKSVDKFVVIREPLGALEQIFPEIPLGKIERKSSAADLFHEILANRYLAIRVGDRFVASDLAARVYKVALSNCLPATPKNVSAAREKHFPLLWVGIRVGDRSWDNQAEGLAKAITSLHEEFPKLGVVFDGFSWPADRSAQADRQEYADIINEEKAVVAEVVGKLQDRQNGIGIFNIIGSSISDANVWAHAIDVYVSPFGTVQHKVGWLANKPGIIHTNQSLLQSRHYVWAAIENAFVPRYVRRSSVSDIRSTQKTTTIYKQLSEYNEAGAGVQAMDKRVHGDPEFYNYAVEWKPLVDDLLELIRSRKSMAKFSRPILVYSVKYKLKNTLRRLTSTFDESKI